MAKPSRRSRRFAREKEARRRAQQCASQTPKLPSLCAVPVEDTGDLDDEPEIHVEIDVEETPRQSEIPDPPASHERAVVAEEERSDGPAECGPVNCMSVMAKYRLSQSGDEDGDDEVLVPKARLTAAEVADMIMSRHLEERQLPVGSPYRRMVVLDSGVVVQRDRMSRQDPWKTRLALRQAKQSDADRTLDAIVFTCACHEARRVGRTDAMETVRGLKHLLNFRDLESATSRTFVREIWREMHALHGRLEGNGDEESTEFLEALWSLFMVRVRRNGTLGEIVECLRCGFTPTAFRRLLDQRREPDAVMRLVRAA